MLTKLQTIFWGLLFALILVSMSGTASVSCHVALGHTYSLYPTDNLVNFKDKPVGQLHFDFGGRLTSFCIKQKHLHPEKIETMRNWRQLSEFVPLNSIKLSDLKSIWGNPTSNIEYSTIPTNHSRFLTFKLKGICNLRAPKRMFFVDVKFIDSKLCSYRIRGDLVNDSRWLGIR